MTPYQMLKKESKSIGWPVAYKTDLTKHDLNLIRKNKNKRFFWILREHGTHLFIIEDSKYPLTKEHDEYLLKRIDGAGKNLFTFFIDVLEKYKEHCSKKLKITIAQIKEVLNSNRNSKLYFYNTKELKEII